MQALRAGFLCMLVACRPEAPPPIARTALPDAGSAEHHDHHDEETLIELSDDVLRDLRLTTARVESRTGGATASALGEVRVNEEALAVVGVPVDGRVVKLRVRVGDRVQKGQVVADLLSPTVGKARADVLHAQGRVNAAQKVLEREEDLLGKGLTTSREAQGARMAKDAAQLELEAARLTLRAMGLSSDLPSDEDLAIMHATAPIAGVVMERPAVLGQMVHSDDVLAKIADLSTVWVVAHVFERDAVRLQKGARATLTLPALPGERLEAVVDHIGQSVDPSLRTAPVRMIVQNEKGRLKPGMSANAELSVGTTDGKPMITVPAAAIQRVDDAWCVFVPRGQGHFERREVARGRDLGGEVEVLSGLEQGEEIVVNGSFIIRAQSMRGHMDGEHHHH